LTHAARACIVQPILHRTMPTTVPFKTPLGHEELRTRAHKLGQRHRTMLFLIDGRRPLAAVLSLAQQAGAATHHFEDLLRLGFVELPPEPLLPASPPAVEDEAAIVATELVVPGPALAESADAGGDTAAEAAPTQRAGELPGVLAEDPQSPFERTVRLAPVPREANAALPVFAGVPPAAAADEVASPVTSQPDLALPLPDGAEAELLREVRGQLSDTLRIDAPLFSARVFMRLRSAQSRGELIELVWEIEQHLSHKGDRRREQQSLQRARELLGLGNTLVAEDETRAPPAAD
jgi:hypothetical protein